jgi:septal ring factor EnvC (AmiA/AmiB activator)
MLRLGLWPAESLLAVPGPPEDRLRGLLVLQGLSRQLATEAAAFRATEAEAARRAADAAERAAALREAQAQARAASAALDAELKAARDRRAGAQDAEEEAARRAASTAARASSLESALARLRQEQAREAAEARARDAAEARERATAAQARSRRAEAEMAAARTPDPPPRASGGRAKPVLGRVTREFGAAGEGGPARGLTLQAAAGARVVSPCGGRAVFAAPFRSFGQLLIVDCGDGYHVVLAGLDRLDAVPGQRLLAGEPIGQLGEAALYLELRRNGQPVDPRGWFSG